MAQENCLNTFEKDVTTIVMSLREAAESALTDRRSLQPTQEGDGEGAVQLSMSAYNNISYD